MVPRLPVDGDVVVIRRRRWTVTRARFDSGLTRLDVASRQDRRTFLAPFDRVTAATGGPRLIRGRGQQARARLAAALGGTSSMRSVTAAVTADVAILPYQLEAALAVRAGATRLLVADAVGLGKTIQAALVAADLLARRPEARILIVAPVGLHRQWADELRRRFGLRSRAADRAGLEAAARTMAFGDDPWSAAGPWIASIDFLKQPHVAAGMPIRPWDLLIVDEAHDVCGDSARYRCCAELARRARVVLLLSATPHSGDGLRASRLVHLGALSRTDPPATVLRRTRASVGLPAARVARWSWVSFSAAETRVLEALDGFERQLLRTAVNQTEHARLLLGVYRKRALSTMHALRETIVRRRAWLEASSAGDSPDWIQRPLRFDDEQRDDLVEADAAALSADLGVAPTEELAWIDRLVAGADRARLDESKVRRVAALVARTREPVVVFTEFRESLAPIEAALGSIARASVLHGGLDSAARTAAVDEFLAGGTRVLLATDVASQGLNLQTRARWVITLELPWNPARLEQRIGRVDRIGQSRRPHLTLVVARHTAESGVLRRITRRVAIARLAVGDEVLAGTLPDERAVRDAVIDGHDDAGPPGRPVGVTLRPRTTWMRSARLASAGAIARRRWRQAWRQEPASAPRAVLARWSRLGRLRHVTGTLDLMVFAVAIATETGEAVERHVVTVGVRPDAWPPDARGLEMAIALARRTAADVVSMRLPRLAQRLRARHLRPDRRARDLWRHAVAVLSRDRGQPGLFDRRELHAIDRAARQLDEVRRALAVAASGGPAARTLDDGPIVAVTSRLSVESPRLVLVVSDRW